jgi:hypothetical protein
LSWPTQIGKLYRVTTKTNLAATTWTQLSSDIVAAGLTNRWTDTTASSNPRRFYRIEIP